MSSPSTSIALKNFIFGYGSLICHESRIKTAPSLANVTAIPVMVENLQRMWAARIDSRRGVNAQNLMGWTAVGVSIQEGTNCNGVLLPVNDDELQLFDKREKHYKRVHVHWSLISKFGGGHFDEEMMETSNVWVYAQESTVLANRYFPIPQSYVDVIMKGCLSISDEFCKTFIETTQGWWYEPKESDLVDLVTRLEANGEEKKVEIQDIQHLDIEDHLVWVDDRLQPGYKNSGRTILDWTESNYHMVDEILLRYAPVALERRRKIDIPVRG